MATDNLTIRAFHLLGRYLHGCWCVNQKETRLKSKTTPEHVQQLFNDRVALEEKK
jgi:hypothetical protein